MVVPVVPQLIPLIIAGLVAIAPIAHINVANKDNYNSMYDKTTDNSKITNDKTNSATTKIVTIREGFKGVVQDGQIFQVPFYQKTTVEKSYTGREEELGRQEQIANKQQDANTHEVEEQPSAVGTVFNGFISSSRAALSSVWRRVKL